MSPNGLTGTRCPSLDARTGNMYLLTRSGHPQGKPGNAPGTTQVGFYSQQGTYRKAIS